MTRVRSPETLPTGARRALLERYQSRIVPHPGLNRSLVSFQGNRRAPLFSWFKYKEGFSAQLVQQLITHLTDSPGVLLDPFAGGGASLFVARSLGWNAIGIEVLPVALYAMDARLAADRVKAPVLKHSLDRLPDLRWSDYFDPEFAFRHIPITEKAFPPETERAIAGYRAWCRRSIRDPDIRKLLDFACFAVLESLSYTRKDGQYLRWDYRARKPHVTTRFAKPLILDFASAIRAKLEAIYLDLAARDSGTSDLYDFVDRPPNRNGTVDLRLGSCLEVLPQLDSASIDLVLTSPPYCNRYDYTRTYALELAYLGLDADDVKCLRQKMLSCTVENRSKVDQLAALYRRDGSPETFQKVDKVFAGEIALQEVLGNLEALAARGELNNNNIPKMVRNYFFEMCFVIYELSRVLRRARHVVMINDNVRYAGQEIPVDLILSDFAASFGLRVKRIWTLPRGKGNSSQQMGSHGRSELRKCVYVWQKP